MADIDLLPLRGVPFAALVDATGVATGGTSTVAQLAGKGMRAIAAVDPTGLALDGTSKVADLAARGIRAFAPVDENGISTDDAVSTADVIRMRGIRPMVAVDANGVSQTGSATIPVLAQRGLGYFCPLDESGNATSLVPVPPNTIRARPGMFTLTGESMTIVSGYAIQASMGGFALIDPGTTKLTPPSVGPPVLVALGMQQGSGTGTTNMVPVSQPFASTPLARRMVIVSWTSSGGQTTSSGTVTPNVGTAKPITIVENFVDPSNGSGGIGYAILGADADTASSLVASVTHPNDPFVGTVFAMWTAKSTDFADTAPTGHSHVAFATTTTQTTTVATSAGGFIVAATLNDNATNSCTLSGTETFSNSVLAAYGDSNVAGNTTSTIATNASSAVTTTWANSGLAALFAAAWR